MFKMGPNFVFKALVMISRGLLIWTDRFGTACQDWKRGLRFFLIWACQQDIVESLHLLDLSLSLSLSLSLRIRFIESLSYLSMKNTKPFRSRLIISKEFEVTRLLNVYMYIASLLMLSFLENWMCNFSKA